MLFAPLGFTCLLRHSKRRAVDIKCTPLVSKTENGSSASIASTSASSSTLATSTDTSSKSPSTLLAMMSERKRRRSLSAFPLLPACRVATSAYQPFTPVSLFAVKPVDTVLSQTEQCRSSRVVQSDPLNSRRVSGTECPDTHVGVECSQSNVLIRDGLTHSTNLRDSGVVSVSLVNRLLTTVISKRINWKRLVNQHPNVARLPILGERHYWISRYCSQGSATPIFSSRDTHDPSRETPLTACVPPVLLCTAATGTGKSVLVPLFLADAHWRTLQTRLTITVSAVLRHDEIRNHSIGDTCEAENAFCKRTTGEPGGMESVSPFVITTKEFITSFRQCSRVCIVVSQPTRLACVQLAKYTATLLAEAPVHSASTSEENDLTGVGQRVGYAVGGESRFCEASEIVFATPGYILNSLRQSTVGSDFGERLCPTTLVVDEAHGTDLETALLLATVKHYRETQAERVGSTMPASVDCIEWALRQVIVMSATMSVQAMRRYFTLAKGLSSSESLPHSWPVVMLFEEQREALKMECLRADVETQMGHNGVQGNTHDEGAAQVTTVSCGPPKDNVTQSVGMVDTEEERQQRSGAVAEWVQHEKQETELHGMDRSRPYRIERYFIEDLKETILESSVLFSPWQNAISRGGGSTALRRQAPFAPDHPEISVPLLLIEEGQQLREKIIGYFSTTNTRASLFGQAAQTFAQLLLYLIQALHQRDLCGGLPSSSPRVTAQELISKDSCCSVNGLHATGEPKVPVGLLVFLPGFAEIQALLQALERLCSPVAPRSRPNSKLTEEYVQVMQFGQEHFSVPVLHASGVGNPQGYLDASASCGAPYRILLATSVAESSVTIPNVQLVVDMCLERKFVQDPVTGTTHKRTTVVDSGGLRQRAGRTGRTCDGAVIHLVPRHSFAAHSGVSDLHPPLSDSDTTVLLRAKSIFGAQCSHLLQCMPRPLSALALQAAVVELYDRDVFVPPVSITLSEGNAAVGTKELAQAQGQGTLSTATTVQKCVLPADEQQVSYSATLCHQLDESRLSLKGRVLAALPIPPEQALLIYHGLQFACVEDALLIACAMTVPTLFVTPRVAAHSIVAANSRRGTSSAHTGGDNTAELLPALSPLEQYYKTIWVQRQLAGFSVPGDPQGGNPTLSQRNPSEVVRRGVRYGSGREDDAQPQRQGSHLSEPLLLRTILTEWYTCPSSEALGALVTRYNLNRTMLRSVDISVAQCCARLVNLLEQDGEHATRNIDTDMGQSLSSYQDASTFTTYSLIEQSCPQVYRRGLVKSLLRLRQAALIRAGVRGTSLSRYGLLQWYSAGDQMLSVMGSHTRGETAKTSKDATREAHRLRSTAIRKTSNTADGAYRCQAHTGRIAFGVIEDRLCAAFIAAFARNTMRGEDGGYRWHHRRLIRNASAIQVSVENVCTFNVDIRSSPTGSTFTGDPSATNVNGSRLCVSPELIASALRPYFRGAGLQQVDTFLTGRSVLAGFAVSGFPGLFSSTEFRRNKERCVAELAPSKKNKENAAVSDMQSYSTNTLETAVDEWNEENRAVPPPKGSGELLAPRVVLYEGRHRSSCNTGADSSSEILNLAASGRGNHAVQLAPFGVSLLIASQSALQRIPLPQVGKECSTGAVRSKLSCNEPQSRHGFIDCKNDLVACTGSENTTATDSPVAPRRSRAHSLMFTTASACEQLNTHVSDAELGGAGLPCVDEEVTWVDDYGRERRLSRQRVEELQLGHLYPTQDTTVRPFSDASIPSSLPLATQISRDTENGSVSRDSFGPPQARNPPILLSVQGPINVTRGVYWKVSLPSPRWLQHHTLLSKKATSSFGNAKKLPSAGNSVDTGSDGVSTRTPTSTRVDSTGSVHVCDVCGALSIGDMRFASHCRSRAHLQHLWFAVQCGLSKATLTELLGSGTSVFTSLLRKTPTQRTLAEARKQNLPFASGRTVVPLTSSATELHPCATSHLSFLNALQWGLSEDGDTLPPLAVAGSLLSTVSSLDVASPVPGATAHEGRSNNSRPTPLTAYHVWVLNFGMASMSAEEGSPERRRGDTNGFENEVNLLRKQHSQSPRQRLAVPLTEVPTEIMIVAGYLAASSHRCLTALLWNASHTHVHGVMLHDWGVWRLPRPVRMLHVDALQRLIFGRVWQGMAVGEVDDTHLSASATGDVYQGLHWCVVSEECPECTFHGYSLVDETEGSRERSRKLCLQKPERERCNSVAKPHPRRSPPSVIESELAHLMEGDVAPDSLVASALLVVLQEYVLARRNVATLIDLLERTIMKLDGHAIRTTATLAAHPAALTSTGVKLLRDFLARRAPQTLEDVLRDLGCLFVTPPSALHLVDFPENGNSLFQEGANCEDNTTTHVDWRRLLSPAQLSIEGAATEVMFTLPPILPSLLPSALFAETLFAFHNSSEEDKSVTPGEASPSVSSVRF